MGRFCKYFDKIRAYIILGLALFLLANNSELIQEKGVIVKIIFALLAPFLFLVVFYLSIHLLGWLWPLFSVFEKWKENNSKLLDFLDDLSKLGILVGIGLFLLDRPERIKQIEYQAWQVIAASHGKPGSGGRREALEDLLGLDSSLAGVDCSNAFLEKVQLNGANLRGANFQNSRTNEGSFRHASLVFAKFSFSSIRMADFSSADLRGAKLINCDLSESKFRHSRLMGSHFQGSDFRNADLNFATFHEDDMTEFARLSSLLDSSFTTRADVSRTHFNQTQLVGTRFEGVDLKGAVFAKYLMKSTVFSGSNLNQANFNDMNIVGVDFVSSNLQGTSFFNCSIKGADFTRAKINSKQWFGVRTLENSNMRYVEAPSEFFDWAKNLGAVVLEDEDEWQAIRQKYLLIGKSRY